MDNVVNINDLVLKKEEVTIEVKKWKKLTKMQKYEINKMDEVWKFSKKNPEKGLIFVYNQHNPKQGNRLSFLRYNVYKSCISPSEYERANIYSNKKRCDFKYDLEHNFVTLDTSLLPSSLKEFIPVMLCRMAHAKSKYKKLMEEKHEITSLLKKLTKNTHIKKEEKE